MKFIILAAFAFTCGFAYATTSEEVSTKTKEAAAAAADYTKEQKDQFQKDMEAKLADIKKEIAELSEKAAKKTGETKNEMRAQVKALETRQEVLKKDLAKLKKSSGNAWVEMKTGVSKAWDNLTESYDKAKAEFKESN